jgi:signal transduction histidine kinase
MTGWRRIPNWMVDVLVVAVATADVWATAWQLFPFYELDFVVATDGPEFASSDMELFDADLLLWERLYVDERLMLAAATLGVLALTVRRRWPLMVFVVTLPPLLWLNQTAASLIALYTLASLSRNRILIAGCVLILAVNSVLLWEFAVFQHFDDVTAILFAQSLAQAAAAAFLGQLVQARRELSLKLREISATRDHEQRLITQTALAAERSLLAREMHDVVSHQVSLIAVRAGALQVNTGDPTAKEAAQTIRELSVKTLDELRQMVNVLRTPDSAPVDLSPQPTLDGLGQLVSGSALDARLEVDELPDLDSPTQRAIYRMVQEALTNVRKHAPGASATVRIRRVGDAVHIDIMNTPATRPITPLPGSNQGLLGLNQRVELLGGTLDYGPLDRGGWQVRAQLPVEPFASW